MENTLEQIKGSRHKQTKSLTVFEYITHASAVRNKDTESGNPQCGRKTAPRHQEIEKKEGP